MSSIIDAPGWLAWALIGALVILLFGYHKGIAEQQLKDQAALAAHAADSDVTPPIDHRAVRHEH